MKGFALPATSKETAQIISSGLKDFKDLTDGNELHRVFQRLTCAVTAALSPTAGKPGQA
nr:hypothetical protein [uncultured Brevundimonas sp.]